MRRHLYGVVLVFIASGINLAAACEEHVPTAQPPEATEPSEYEDQAPAAFASSNSDAKYRFAGIGFGSMLLAGTAAFAIAKRR